MIDMPKGSLVISALLLTAGIAATACPAAAADLRCDSELVGRGMTPLEVLERCGEPEFEYGWTDYRYPGLFVRVDLWTYHLGENRFRRELMFENGRLRRIETRRKPRRSLAASAAALGSQPH
ncbi:MAG: DUF2845 domain-containing protein [Pseudomonadales bacterium]